MKMYRVNESKDEKKDFTGAFKEATEKCFGGQYLRLKKDGDQYRVVSSAPKSLAKGIKTSLSDTLEKITGRKWNMKVVLGKSSYTKGAAEDTYIFTLGAVKKMEESARHAEDCQADFVNAFKRIEDGEKLLVRKVGEKRYEITANDRYTKHSDKWYSGSDDEGEGELPEEVGEVLKKEIEKLTGMSWGVIPIVNRKGDVEKFVFRILNLIESRVRDADDLSTKVEKFIRREFGIDKATLEEDYGGGYNLYLPKDTVLDVKDLSAVLKFIKKSTGQKKLPQLYIDKKTGASYIDEVVLPGQED